MCSVFFFQAEDGIRDLVRSRGLGDVYKRQYLVRIHLLSAQPHLTFSEVAQEVEGNTGHVEHPHFTFQTMGMQMFGIRGVIPGRCIDVQQVGLVLMGSAIGLDEGVAPLEFGVGDIEGFRNLSLIHISEPTRPS